MRKNRTRAAKSFTIDRDTVRYLNATSRNQSASQRVNELLRRAIVAEQYDALEREAAAFFADVSDEEREEARAFQSAALKTLSRE